VLSKHKRCHLFHHTKNILNKYCQYCTGTLGQHKLARQRRALCFLVQTEYWWWIRFISRARNLVAVDCDGAMTPWPLRPAGECAGTWQHGADDAVDDWPVSRSAHVPTPASPRYFLLRPRLVPSKS